MNSKSKLTIHQPADKEHQDSIWYDGEIATITKGDRKVVLCACGEVRINNKEGEIVYDGKERNSGIKGGFKTDKDLKKIGCNYDDKYCWEHNNWFELVYYNKDKPLDIMSDVYHEYNSALNNLKESVNEDKWWEELKD